MIVLREEFYREIRDHPIPIDLEAVRSQNPIMTQSQ